VSGLKPLLERVRSDGHDYVAVFLSDAGIHWRGGSREECQCIADIVGGCRVMPREEFIKSLEEV
jgi:hypothetical protein